MITQARRDGEEVTEHVNRYKTLMKSAAQRRRAAKRERAQEITKKIAELKTSTRRLYETFECLGIIKGSKRRLGPERCECLCLLMIAR